MYYSNLHLKPNSHHNGLFFSWTLIICYFEGFGGKLEWQNGQTLCFSSNNIRSMAFDTAIIFLRILSQKLQLRESICMWHMWFETWFQRDNWKYTDVSCRCTNMSFIWEGILILIFITGFFEKNLSKEIETILRIMYQSCVYCCLWQTFYFAS